MRLFNQHQYDYQTEKIICELADHIRQETGKRASTSEWEKCIIIALPLLVKAENFMLLSRVHLLFINQLWYKHSVITAENLRFSNPTVEKYLLC